MASRKKPRRQPAPTVAEPGDSSEPASHRGLWVVVATTAAVLALFVNKAYTIDDTLFLFLAKHLRQQPFDFYNFEVNWYGVVMPMSRITKNPPLTGYVIAAMSEIGGFKEVFLHSVFLIVACLSAAGSWALARLFCARPVEAALLGVLTPVFLVSSTNVMCDTMMMAFYLWAMWWWVRDVRGETKLGIPAAALLAALAGLTKYFGFTLIPLLMAYDVFVHRRLRPHVAWLLLPVAAAVAYQLGTDAAYGRGLLTDAAEYSGRLREWQGQSRIPGFGQSLTGLIFLGGCLLPSLLLAPLLWPKKWVLMSGFAIVGASMITAGAQWLPGWTVEAPTLRPLWLIHPQAWLMAAGGASFLALVITDWLRHKDSDSLLLVLLALGTFAFAAYVNWVNNGRSNLPLAPVMGILLIRRLEFLGWKNPLRNRKFQVAGGLAAALAIAVAFGDMMHANGVRDAVERIDRRYLQRAPRTHFQGHWGFQYYMEGVGARPLDLSRDPVYQEEIVVVPSNNTDSFPLPEVAVKLVESIEGPRFFVHTIYGEMGAGFYASNVGPLPFVFGTGAPETHDVYSVTQGFTGQLNKQAMPWW